MKANVSLLLVVLAVTFTNHPVHAQSTAFTYQGALSDENGSANGMFEHMAFGLFTTDTGGDAVSTVTHTSVSSVPGVLRINDQTFSMKGTV